MLVPTSRHLDEADLQSDRESVFPCQRHGGKQVPPRYRSELSRLRAWNPCCIAPNASPRRRENYPDRLRSCRSQHSFTVRLLCNEARNSGVHRFTPLRALSRQKQRKVTVVHIPAMNTSQFTWVKSRLPRLPQPVLPIYEPEVGARVVLYAGMTPSLRREYWVGGSTVKAILGQKIVPGLLDRYLGKTGYKSQQREMADSTTRPHNLWHPVPTSLGGHGPFKKEARTFSLEANATTHPGWFLFGCGLIGAALCAKKLLSAK